MMLRIRNWERWQTYRKDRGLPPWIKLHRCVLRDPDWVLLTDQQRGQLVCIWMLAADRGGVVPDDPVLIQKLCQMTHKPNLKLFISKGFLFPDAKVTPLRRQLGVNVTSLRRQRDAPKAEAEADEE